QRLKCKVISVGNITLGGTGKTTLVEFIARYLKQQGHRVAILSRGYKRLVQSSRFKVQSYETMGDEPYMLQENLQGVPVIVDKDRLRSAARAIRDYSVDTVILDDGFQQWRIKKDLEIITIDAVNPFGNRHLLPRGILRQGLSALRRPDVFILTKTNLNPDIGQIKEALNELNPHSLIVESVHEPLGFYNINHPKEILSSGSLKGKSAALFSGIGDPESFENLIARCGIHIGLSFRFRDHHNYTKQDLDKVIQSAREKNIDTIITTAKDAARLLGMADITGQLSILVLRIALKVTKNEEGLFARLVSLYSC
ncbi:MAG: tetraacyldisaccharide 4'-kinase, partial [Candidatus Omnitrophica bacterium]|nr:tetraacyldisaccharide 4'-kinase [Candidatus Omnitrophota bacterium]